MRPVMPARLLALLAIATWALVSCAVAIACSSAPSAEGDADGSTDAASTDVTVGDVATVDSGREAGGDAADSATLPDSTAADAPVEAGPPSLAALGVSGTPSTDASAPVALVPPFSPDVHDYYVRCGAGVNVLTVSMTAAAGSTSLLVQPTTSPSLPEQTLSVSVAESQALVAAATNDTATVEYWVRCLPHDFPRLQWAPHADAGTPAPGYYLIGTDAPTGSGCYAMILDGRGVPVWYTQAQPELGWCVFDVDSVVSGAVSFDSVIDYPAEFEIHQLSPPVTTKITATDVNVDLHELVLLENGDYLVISSPLQSGVDLTGSQVLLLDGGVETVSGPQTIMACNLVEFRPDGTVVWTWTGTDHFDAVKDSVSPTVIPYGPTATVVFDPFHCNSIDVEPTTGNLLVSARQMDSIFSIERSTGRVLWKMGGAVFNKDDATYVSVADPFSGQHDARFQPDWLPGCNGGSGHISLFDDETYTGAPPARAVVYDVVVGAGDGGSTTGGGCGDGGLVEAGTAGTATVSWQRAGAVPSLAMGSFRILPDGSRIIGWGAVPGIAFTEVDVEGNDLLDMGFPDGNTTYRALKVPPSAFDLSVLRSTAGLP